MMRRILIPSVFFAIAIIGCSASPSKALVRNDLSGKPLTIDDFSIIVGGKIVKAFYSKEQLTMLFPGVEKKDSKIWKWSVLHDSGEMSQANIEYTTRSLRFVYFDEIVNDYTGILKEALTIRGIGIGDSAKDVLAKYGESYFKNENSNSFFSEDNGLIYRFYNYPETAKTKYPSFDSIHFETRAGKVVGIHYWKNYSDAP
jgi:hypothetical protein